MVDVILWGSSACCNAEVSICFYVYLQTTKSSDNRLMNMFRQVTPSEGTSYVACVFSFCTKIPCGELNSRSGHCSANIVIAASNKVSMASVPWFKLF